MPTKSAIAILTYRRLPALQETLAGVLKFCKQYPLAIFEDCGQTDGTEAWLIGQNGRQPKARLDLLAQQYSGAHLGPGVQVFLGTANLGVSGNSNRAIHWFMNETDCDHLCLLNDDLHVIGDFVNFYARGHEDLGVGLFCFCDLFSESHRWITINARGYKVKLLPRMTGIMMSIKREVVDRIGYYDVRYPQMGEEHPCPGNSLVWMGDYTFKPIDTIRPGNCVIGWAKREAPAKRYGKEIGKAKGLLRHNKLQKATVLGVVSFIKDIAKVTFKSGRSLYCAPEHTWLNYYASKKDQSYVPAEIGRTLVHVVEPVSDFEETLEYKKGYVRGLVAGDGGVAHGAVVQRTTQLEVLQRLHAYLAELGVPFTVCEWDYAEKKPARRRFTPLDRRLHITRFLGESDWDTWSTPETEDWSWRGWLAGVYDAEGYGRSFGQNPQVHPNVYKNIVEGLKRFGFEAKPQKHQIYLQGGWRELVRFWNLCRPCLTYKLDDAVLVGGYRTPDKVVSVTPIGRGAVYCLKTTTGNYVIQGYASKNCDFTIRARLGGFVSLDGQMQNCLDLDHGLLKHQEVVSSVAGEERKRLDDQAWRVMSQISKKYGQEPIFRPFYLRLPKMAGGHAGTGIPVDNLGHYVLVDAPV